MTTRGAKRAATSDPGAPDVRISAPSARDMCFFLFVWGHKLGIWGLFLGDIQLAVLIRSG